nr:uncharacterized protein LOC113813214 [Penaeus vannamei]
MQRLRRSVREKRRELWPDNSWLLHYNNAPAHNALSIRQFLTEESIAFKGVIKGTRFEDKDDIKMDMAMELRRILEKFFQECMHTWQRRMKNLGTSLTPQPVSEAALHALCQKFVTRLDTRYPEA